MTFNERLDQILGKPFAQAKATEYAPAWMQTYREGYRPVHHRTIYAKNRTRKQRMADAAVTLWVHFHKAEMPAILGMPDMPQV